MVEASDRGLGNRLFGVGEDGIVSILSLSYAFSEL